MRIEPPGALMMCECVHCSCQSTLRLQHGPTKFIGHEVQGEPNWNVRIATTDGIINICAMCWDDYYKRTAPVPDSRKIEWSKRNICPSCGVENLYPSGKHSESDSSIVSEFGECSNCGVGFGFISVRERETMRDSVGVSST